jgi:hypothetical protein
MGIQRFETQFPCLIHSCSYCVSKGQHLSCINPHPYSRDPECVYRYRGKYFLLRFSLLRFVVKITQNTYIHPWRKFRDFNVKPFIFRVYYSLRDAQCYIYCQWSDSISLVLQYFPDGTAQMYVNRRQ